MAEENEGEGEGMSEDFVEDDNAAVLTITCRFSSAVPLGRTECSDRALELSELQVEQLPYFKPIITQSGILHMRVESTINHGYAMVSNVLSPNGVTLVEDPCDGDIGMLASAMGWWSNLDEWRFLANVAAVGVRQIPLHHGSEVFKSLTIDERRSRAAMDRRESNESHLSVSVRDAFAYLRRRATGLGAAEIYYTKGHASSQDMVSLTVAPGPYPLPLAIDNGSDLMELLFTCHKATARAEKMDSEELEERQLRET